MLIVPLMIMMIGEGFSQVDFIDDDNDVSNND